jgi:flavodoxin
MKKRLLASFLALALMLLGNIQAFAAVNDTGFSDVDADAWYADAVIYCRDNGIMSGTGNAAFSPETTLSRAMLATILWRLDGSQTPTATHTFTDVAPDQWYSDAIAWASSEGIISGYNPQTFGTNDLVTREQTAVLLYRYAEYKVDDVAASAQLNFTDAGNIASWATSAVTWANENEIISGWPGERFNPQSNATRAEAADAIYRYLTANQSEPETQTNTEQTDGKILVAYFTRTGTTERMANTIHDIVGGDILEIDPVTPYPTDYQEALSKAQQELGANARPALTTTVSNMDDYDVIFIGYPIWYGTCPMTVFTFLDSYDLSGKTIVPFSTSGSSGISTSERAIADACPDSTMLKGLGLTSSNSGNPENAVKAWLDGLEIK